MGVIFMRKNISTENRTGYIRAIILSTLLSSFICALLYIFSAFLFTQSRSLPYVVISQLSFILSVVASFIGGTISAKISKSKGLFTGAATGFLLFVIIFIVYYIILQESFTSISLIRAIALILSGAIGGVIGVNRNIKKR